MDSSSSKWECAAYVILLGLIVCLPLPLASNRPWAWSLMELVIALQSLLLAYHYRSRLPWQWLKHAWVLLAGLAGFQALTLLQLVPLPASLVELLSPSAYQLRSVAAEGSLPATLPLSLDPNQTLVNLLKGCCYLLLAINCSLLLNQPERLRQLMLAFVIGGTFQAFYGAMLLLADFSLSPVFAMPISGNATGSFIYKNHYANYLLMCLCMGLALVVADLNQDTQTSWRQRLGGMIEALLSSKMLVRMCMVIMVIGLVMSHSRMGNTAFFAVTLIGALLALCLFRQRPRSLTVLFASVIVIDLLVVSSLFGLDKVRQRLSETVLVEEGRVDILAWAQPMLQDYWLTGSGAGSFYALFQNYAPVPLTEFYDHAHNDYLQFAIESGLLASLILAAAVSWVLLSSLWAIRRRKDPLLRAATLGCSMAIIGMLIHISVDFNLQAPANAACFIVILCLASSAARMPRKGYVEEAY